VVGRYQFLSAEWLEESRRIREEYQDRVPAVAVPVRMNQIINEVPFGDGVIKAYVDTTTGILDMEVGHLDHPDLTITLSYVTAKAILVDGDAAQAMNAFMSGRIKVDGDITKLIALQTAGSGGAGGVGNQAATEVLKKIQDITA
jgi:putative sterol carrier protein